jgi:hypothetical protein
VTRADRHCLLQQLAFSESRHLSWDNFPANTMAYDSSISQASGLGCAILLDSHRRHTCCATIDGQLLYNFINKKLSILHYHSISYIGIVKTWRLPYLLNHPTNNSTMVSPLPLRRHGFGKSIHPTPGGLFGRGRPRSWWKDFTNTNHRAEKKINLSTPQFYFSFYYAPHSIAAKTMDLHPPPRSPTVRPPLSTTLHLSGSFFGGCCV